MTPQAMMSSRISKFSLLGAGFLLCTGIGRGDAFQRVLSEVKELRNPVSYSETKVSVGDLVKRLGRETGVPLSAAPEVAEEPIAVVVSDYPAGQLMDQIADLLDYTWIRRGNDSARRYEICQDLGGKQREEALRRAGSAEAMRRLQSAVSLYVAIASLAPDQIEEIRKGTVPQSLIGRGAPMPPWNEGNDAQKRMYRQIAAHVSLPGPKALARLLGFVTSAQWEKLREQGSISFSSDPRDTDYPLPAPILDTLRATPRLNGMLGSKAGGEDDAPSPRQRQEDERQRRWEAADGYRVTLQMAKDAGSGRPGAALQLEVNAVPLQLSDAQEAPSFWPDQKTALFIRVGPSNNAALTERRTGEEQAALDRDPILGRKRHFRPTSTSRLSRVLSAETPLAAWQLYELLPELATVYRVQFISDAYWTAPVIQSTRLPQAVQPVALYSMLDLLTRPNCRWDLQNGLIRLRSRNWFFDRPREVPLRLVRRWEEVASRVGALPLSEYLGAVRQLTDVQLESLMDMVEEGILGPELQDLHSTHTARYALRILASISAARLQAVLEGDALSGVEMSALQRQLFVAPLRDNRRFRIRPLRMLDPPKWMLTVRQEPFIRIREQRGRWITYYRERTAVPTATPSQNRSAPRNTDPRKQRPPFTIRLTRYPVTLLRFVFSYSPQVRQVSWITTAALSSARELQPADPAAE